MTAFLPKGCGRPGICTILINISMDIADCPPSMRLTVLALIPACSATFSCDMLISFLRSRIRLPNSIKSCDPARLPNMHLLPGLNLSGTLRHRVVKYIIHFTSAIPSCPVPGFAAPCRKVGQQKNNRVSSCFYGLLFNLCLYCLLFLFLSLARHALQDFPASFPIVQLTTVTAAFTKYTAAFNSLHARMIPPIMPPTRTLRNSIPIVPPIS